MQGLYSVAVFNSAEKRCGKCTGKPKRNGGEGNKEKG